MDPHHIAVHNRLHGIEQTLKQFIDVYGTSSLPRRYRFRLYLAFERVEAISKQLDELLEHYYATAAEPIPDEDDVILITSPRCPTGPPGSP